MGLVRYLQHWLGGAGPRLQVADFVPDPHPLRQWADTFPWAALVAAVEQNPLPQIPGRLTHEGKKLRTHESMPYGKASSSMPTI